MAFYAPRFKGDTETEEERRRRELLEGLEKNRSVMAPGAFTPGLRYNQRPPTTGSLYPAGTGGYWDTGQRPREQPDTGEPLDPTRPLPPPMPAPGPNFRQQQPPLLTTAPGAPNQAQKERTNYGSYQNPDGTWTEMSFEQPVGSDTAATGVAQAAQARANRAALATPDAAMKAAAALPPGPERDAAWAEAARRHAAALAATVPGAPGTIQPGPTVGGSVDYTGPGPTTPPPLPPPGGVARIVKRLGEPGGVDAINELIAQKPQYAWIKNLESYGRAVAADAYRKRQGKFDLDLAAADITSRGQQLPTPQEIAPAMSAISRAGKNTPEQQGAIASAWRKADPRLRAVPEFAPFNALADRYDAEHDTEPGIVAYNAGLQIATDKLRPGPDRDAMAQQEILSTNLDAITDPQDRATLEGLRNAARKSAAEAGNILTQFREKVAALMPADKIAAYEKQRLSERKGQQREIEARQEAARQRRAEAKVARLQKKFDDLDAEVWQWIKEVPKGEPGAGPKAHKRQQIEQGQKYAQMQRDKAKVELEEAEREAAGETPPAKAPPRLGVGDLREIERQEEQRTRQPVPTAAAAPAPAGTPAPSATGGIPSPTTEADYNAVPSGSQYHHPDDPPNITRRKP